MKGQHKMKSFESRKTKWGFILLAPWIIGFLLFFLKPLVEVVIYSFNDIKIELSGLQYNPVGWKNYVDALTVHSSFNKQFITTISQSIPNTAIIIVFSLMSAILLNGKYRGRLLARAVFFLPIIMATDLISVSLSGATADMIQTAQGDDTSNVMALASFLMKNTNMPEDLLSMILSVVSNVFTTITQSGVQILIFLAGLQTITPSMYEVAKMEGATGYETFWKVTLPMVSSLILTCTIYTLTEEFLRSELTKTMQTVAFTQGQYGLSSAMAVIFLCGALVVIGITAFFVGRKVFYYD